LAEVAGGADEAVAEVPLPEAVGHDAGGQGVVFARGPIGELQAAAALGDFADGLLVFAAEDDGQAAGDEVAELVVLAADLDAGVADRGEGAAGRAAVLHA